MPLLAKYLLCSAMIIFSILLTPYNPSLAGYHQSETNMLPQERQVFGQFHTYWAEWLREISNAALTQGTLSIDTLYVDGRS